MPLDRTVGAFLISGLILYLFYAYRQEMTVAPAEHTAAYDKREAHDELLPVELEAKPASDRVWPSLLLAIAGLAVVVLGGKLLVEGAVGVARSAGISETIIGLTIVAVGTSLPELVTSVIAALRRHSDVALGNVLGSNIYNVLGIGGVTALIAPTAIPSEILRFDGPIMIAVSLLLIAIARSGYSISRFEGAVLLSGYGVYVYSIWPD